jgi:hypothetical protein
MMVDRQLPHPRMAAQTRLQAAPSSLPRLLLALPADDGAPWFGLTRPRGHANYRPTIYASAVARPRKTATRWDEDNGISANPWAFLTFAVLGALLAGLVLLFAFVL